MSLLENAPAHENCTHALAYEIADARVHCYGCDEEWPLVKETAAAPAAKKTRKPRASKVGAVQAPISDSEALRGADVQDAGYADEEPGPEEEILLPDAPAVEGSVPKTSRRAKKAAAVEVYEAAEYHDPGPWHDSVVCPEKGCVSKLVHHGPNIINNGATTYHYGCPTCDDVRVVVHIGPLK